MTGGKRSLARRFASAAAVAAVISGLILLPTPAFAGCHFFFFEPTGYRVNEGAGQITITVERDNEFNPSSVRVRTVNGTATAGQDYTAVDQRIQFNTGTSRTIDVPIREDQAVEGNEQFTVRLSEGQGCQINPNFQYGQNATVTIVDNDQAPPPPPPPSNGGGTQPGTGGAAPSPQASPAPSPTPTLEIDRTPGEGPAVDDTPDTEATEDTSLAADEDEGGGGSAVPIVVAIALIVAGGAGAGLWWLRRRAA